MKFHLETERLILRLFAESDAADVWEYLKAPAGSISKHRLFTVLPAGRPIQWRKPGQLWRNAFGRRSIIVPSC